MPDVRPVDAGASLLSIVDASVWVATGEVLLEDVSWEVGAGETWVVLGPNGAGKSTLLSLASATRFPSRGTVSVLGRTVGAVDVWTLRSHIGVVDQSLRMPPELTVEEIILTGRSGSVQLMADAYTDEDTERVRDLMGLLGIKSLTGRSPRHLSQGEKGRVRIARSLLAEPDLLLLDEPATGLDLMAREELLQAIRSVQHHAPETGVVLVSHHVEELPPTTTHALLIRDGRVVTAGPVDEALTSASLSTCFNGPIALRRQDGRWTARLD